MTKHLLLLSASEKFQCFHVLVKMAQGPSCARLEGKRLFFKSTWAPWARWCSRWNSPPLCSACVPSAPPSRRAGRVPRGSPFLHTQTAIRMKRVKRETAPGAGIIFVPNTECSVSTTFLLMDCLLLRFLVTPTSTRKGHQLSELHLNINDAFAYLFTNGAFGACCWWLNPRCVKRSRGPRLCTWNAAYSRPH